MQNDQVNKDDRTAQPPFTREELQRMARAYPWFDMAREAVPEGPLPAHILLKRSYRPFSAMPHRGAAENLASVAPANAAGSPPATEKPHCAGNAGQRENDTPKEGAPGEGLSARQAPQISAWQQPVSPAPYGAAEAGAEGQLSTLSIIDEFIVKGEHKVTPTPATPEYIPETQQAELPVDDELITEELAEIYYDQELFVQAKAIYERLSLLYPKKSVYFAEIIEKIDKTSGQDTH